MIYIFNSNVHKKPMVTGIIDSTNNDNTVCVSNLQSTHLFISIVHSFIIAALKLNIGHFPT